MILETNKLTFIREEKFISKDAQKLYIFFNNEQIGDIIVGLKSYSVETLIQLAEIILSMKDKELIFNIRNGYIDLIFQYSVGKSYIVKNIINDVGMEEFSFVII